MGTSYKIDLHTHSILSYDGGITKGGYSHALSAGILDYLAITDHNEVAFAQSLHEDLGDKVIIGEEIDTGEGEIVGLYLKEKVLPHLGLEKTITAIKVQAGIVYVPHPLDLYRKGVDRRSYTKYSHAFDIVEIYNQRSLGNPEIMTIAKPKAIASASDAHCSGELGRSFTVITSVPNLSNIEILLSEPKLFMSRLPIKHRLCPSLNKIRKYFGHA